jgi:hypothetical protein
MRTQLHTIRTILPHTQKLTTPRKKHSSTQRHKNTYTQLTMDYTSNPLRTPSRDIGTPPQSSKEGDLPSLLNAPSRNMEGEKSHRLHNSPITSDVVRRKLAFPVLPNDTASSGSRYSLKRRKRCSEDINSNEQIPQRDRKAFRPIFSPSSEGM